MQDGPHEQRMAGRLPVIAALERAFGIDENVGDALDVTAFPLAAADFEERIAGGAVRIGRIEQVTRTGAAPPFLG